MQGLFLYNIPFDAPQNFNSRNNADRLNNYK